MTEIDWKHVSDIATKVATSVALSWSVVERDDVKQEILAHAYEHRRKLEEKYEDPFIWTFCRKAADQYASAQRDARDVEDDQYYYTPKEARLALATFTFTDEEIGKMIGREDDLLKCRVTDALVSARLDASVALTKLPKETRELILRCYVYGLPPENDSQRKAANRGVDALARRMNRDLRKKAHS